MKPNLIPLTVLTTLLALQGPNVVAAPLEVQPARQVEACIAEAQWPVTSRAVFTNGAARDRQVLLGAYTPGVSTFVAFCRAASSQDASRRQAGLQSCVTEADKQAQDVQGAARDHWKRMQARCTALSRL